jgi:hypothetical protein
MIIRIQKITGSGVQLGSTQPTDINSPWIDYSSGSPVFKAYNKDTAVWEAVGGSSGSGGTVTSEQVTKLGVIATPTAPKVIEVLIPATSDFKRNPLEVLKLVSATQDQVSTLSNFNNSDATDFNADSQVIFDGTMRLKTVYQESMVDNGALDTGKLWSKAINKSSFKTIEKIEVL